MTNIITYYFITYQCDTWCYQQFNLSTFLK